MARNFTRASSHRVGLPEPLLQASQISVSAWVRHTQALSGTNEFFTVFSLAPFTTTATRAFFLDVRRLSTINRVNMGWTQSTSERAYFHDITLTTNQWYHLTATVNWTTDPDTCAIYIDGSSVALTNSGGTNSTPDTTGGTPFGWIGALAQGTSLGFPTDHWPGDIAEVAYWSAALTAGEAAALAVGASPSLIRPGSLVDYYPLLGGVNGRVRGTATNSGTVDAAHPPRVFYPRRALRLSEAAAPPPPPPPSSGIPQAPASGVTFAPAGLLIR